MRTEFKNTVPLRIFSGTELRHWAKAEWLVDGIIQSNSVAVIYGPSRAGKSFLALDLAFAISSGKPWFGYTTLRKKVLFCCLEGHTSLPDRVRALLINRSEEDPDDLFYMKDLFDLSDQHDIERLIAAAKPMDVLVIDTFNNASPSVDENDVKDINRTLSGIYRLRNEIPCSVILVHHCGWSQTDRIRGHSALSAAIDTRINVATRDKQAFWVVTGQRNGPEGEKHCFNLKLIDLPHGQSCAISPNGFLPIKPERNRAYTQNQRLVMKHFSSIVSRSKTGRVACAHLVEQASPEISGSTAHKKQRAKEAIDALVKKGALISLADDLALPS